MKLMLIWYAVKYGTILLILLALLFAGHRFLANFWENVPLP